MSETATADYQPVSVEDAQGRILSGVGVSEEALQETIDARQPEPETSVEAPVTAAPSPEPEKPKTRGQKRFDELTREREDAKRQAEAAETRAKELEARLAAWEATRATPAQEPAAAVSPGAPSAASPEFQFPTYEQALASYPALTYEEWDRQRVIAAVKWGQQTLDLDARIRQSIEADRASRGFDETVTQTRTRARQTYPDFDAVLAHHSQLTDVQLPWAVLERVIRHPQSEHIQYQFMRDDALARRIAAMDPVDQWAELRALVPPVLDAVSASSGPGVPFVPPPPMQPVGSGSKTTVRSSADLAAAGTSDYDSSGYREQRRREREGVRRR